MNGEHIKEGERANIVLKKKGGGGKIPGSLFFPSPAFFSSISLASVARKNTGGVN